MNRTFSLLLLSAAVASAEHYDASVFGALEWRSVGPLRGGRSITSAGSSSRPNEYYFGAVGGGLWKTADGGTTDQAPHKSLDDIRRELDAEFAPSATDGLDGPNAAERLASRPSTLPHLDKDEPPTPVPRRKADGRAGLRRFPASW